MNRKMVVKLLCHMLWAEAVLMLPSLILSLFHREWNGATGFAVAIGLLLLFGLPGVLIRPKDRVIYAREGMVIVALSWILLSAFGALPFYFSGAIPRYIDCFFETVSGFTTTGATILAEIESLPRGILFWRSFTHWVGGMGVLVFVLAIVPLAGDRSMHLMRAEVPGPTVGKLVPRVRSTAMILYGIYIAMTVVEVIFLLAGGMPLYDSVVTAFSTAGTGGFGVKNASIAAYGSAYIEWVVTIFMALFGVNFNLFYFILLGQVGRAFRSEELRWYLGIILVCTLAIAIDILPLYSGFGEAVRYSAFEVSSTITTTGFVTANYDLWPVFSRTIILLLMIAGACAGSTGGGIKVVRLIMMVKIARRELKRMIHPRSVSQIKVEGRPVEEETFKGVSAYLCLYALIACGAMLLISFDRLNIEETLSAVITCLGNVGPGFGVVGPVGNFSTLSVFSKLVLSAAMLVGRLEIFPMAMLCVPSVWRKK
mgnify:CR=1 FL=1